MKQTKLIALLFMCTCFYNAAHTQVFSDEINNLHKTVSVAPLNWEAMRIDLNSPPSDLPVYMPKSNPYRRNEGRWYPTKGEVYVFDENELGGHVYPRINDEGFIGSEITIGYTSNLYDSTYCVLNSTPYTKGKDLYDTTYNYKRNPDGSYTPDLKRVYSYHYFDHFEGDSCFYEAILYKWNASTNQWDNWTRQKYGYNNSITEALNRQTGHLGRGNEWVLDFSLYDSMPCNSHNTVDTAYLLRYIRNHSLHVKVAFTYDDPEAGYTQEERFVYQNGHWVSSSFYYDYEWAEWNGFAFTSNIVLGGEIVSPYKVNKVKSYKMRFPDGRNYYYEKWWDTGTTKDKLDTTYLFFGEKMYPVQTTAIRYNEYGDLIEWRRTTFTDPDADGNQTETVSCNSSTYIYDETYGLIEVSSYTGTTFLSGRKYTDFAYYASVPEIESLSKQALSITPNPASGKVSVSALGTIKELQVFNSNGKLVNKQVVENEKITFDTTVLPKGVYLVRAILKNNDTQTGKLVVE